MVNFYQSQVWKDINHKVYKKPLFEIEIMGNKYWGIIKEKSKLSIKFRWYQVMGIEFGLNLEEKSEEFDKEVNNIKRDYKSSFKDILFQLGIIDPIESFETKKLKDSEFVKQIKEKRENVQKYMADSYGLYKSFRENMPLATVEFDLSKGKEKLFTEIRKSSRAHIRKAINKGLQFEFAKESDLIDFYNIWHLTAYNKGFNIIDKQKYNELMDYLLNEKHGNLFLAKLDGEIVSGSICVLYKSNIIYLYGATNRQFGNLGGHQFLKNEIFKRGFDNSYKRVDLFGAAPTGYDSHHLKGVSRFKESLGGSKVEYFGNYDIVFNKTLYEGFKMLKGG